MKLKKTEKVLEKNEKKRKLLEKERKTELRVTEKERQKIHHRKWKRITSAEQNRGEANFPLNLLNIE